MAGAAEAADLAESLRELKGRSGLSYGVLAKRLHMSTSTLHRYCNGDAVPTEFAPVERLARLCKATPDEMVRVHRQWILADAARGKKSSGAGAEARAGSAAGSGSGDGSEAAEASEVSEAAGAAETAEAAEAPDEAGASASSSGASGASGASGVSPVSGASGESDGLLVSLRTDTSTGLDTGTGTGTRTGAATRSGAPARKSRRNVLIAVATVLAVGAATVLGVNLLGGGPDDGSGGKRSVGAAASQQSDGSNPDGRADRPAQSPSTPGTDASGTPASPDPDGSAPAGDGTGTGKGKDGEDGKDGGKNSGEAGGKNSGSGAANGSTPFTVATRSFVYADPCTQHFLVDSGPKDVSPPPNEQDAPGWAASYRAVSADDQLVGLTLQGKSQETVVLEALHVRVVQSGPPLPWTLYSTGVGCGGGVETKSFSVDLDESRPATRPKAGQRDFPYKISENDPEVFYVSARARSHDVSWYLELEWSSGGKRRIEVINDHGKPFRTSGAIGRPYFQHPPGANEWGSVPPKTAEDYQY
ncbi:helix-turn-helix domain-containing protein [Streptomyces sp. NPDC021093]|uniref:helix-turn-helix domain-containing protein n=1 Tax=Streptomyces sp. NPDC021093 TaxID=3365112 RepID=UPI0037889A55